MVRRDSNPIILAALLIIPTSVGICWWHYSPVYQRRQYLIQAERALEAENLSAAEEVLHRLLADDPEDLRTVFLYAQLLRKKGRIAEAWTMLHQALQLGLSESEGLREYALLESKQDFPLAVKALSRVLEDNPEDTEVLKSLAEGYAGVQRWLEAERIYSRWLEIEPSRADLHLERAKILLKAGRANQSAEEIQEVLRRSPHDFQARLLLAQCLMNDFKMDEAEAELRECRRLRPSSSEPLVGLASCAAEFGDWERAQMLAREALALDPKSPLALHMQGNLYLCAHKLDLAITVYEKITRLFPRDKQAHLNLARAFSLKGDSTSAKKHEDLFQRLDLQDNQRARETQRMP
ncbi:MAG: tetratricopeptide repeat protein [Gemmataceae bacterium]